MNAGGDGRQCLVSRNQIDISPDLIDFDFINFARYPKATNKEFASTIVVCEKKVSPKSIMILSCHKSSGVLTP
jgi:hypothetical protein